MREWQRAKSMLMCGGPCRGFIRKDAIFMLITYEAGKRARCAACAKRQFGEDAPTTVAEPEPFRPPMPSLPMQVERKPDFVRPKHISLPKAIRDIKALQAGEREPGAEG